MLKLYHTNYDANISNDQLLVLMSLLPAREREKFSRYRKFKDKCARVTGRLLLQYGFSDLCLSSCRLDKIKKTCYGKPTLQSDIEFNLSHTDSCVICAISDEGRIGVDLELMSDTDMSFLRAYVEDDRWTELQQSKEPNHAVIAYWTKLEAVLKADGRGLSIPFHAVKLTDDTAVLKKKRWYIRRIDLGRTFICHLATEKRIGAVGSKSVPILELLNGEAVNN